MVKKRTNYSKNYKNMGYAQRSNSINNKSNVKTKSIKNDFSSSNGKTKRLKVNDLETTTRIRIDNDRLNDYDSLDTSFLEGRISSKKTSKIINKESGIKLTNKDNRKRNSRRNLNKSKKVDKTLVFSVFIIVVIGVLITFAVFSLVNLVTGNFSKTVVKTKIVEKEVIKNVTDENIVFLGDSITWMYKLDEHFEGHNVINSGISGDTTKKVLERMEEDVYIYNPSKVVLLIGTNDFIYGMSLDETLNNIKEIIDNLKTNRKYAEIYIESVYPINDTDNSKINHDMVCNRKNEKIDELNKEIKKICKEEKVKYIDLTDILKDEDGNLNLDYTYDGLHMNEEGYKVISKELIKYIEEK